MIHRAQFIPIKIALLLRYSSIVSTNNPIFFSKTGTSTFRQRPVAGVPALQGAAPNGANLFYLAFSLQREHSDGVFAAEPRRKCISKKILRSKTFIESRGDGSFVTPEDATPLPSSVRSDT